MLKTKLSFLLLSVFIAFSAQAEVQTRTLNNGNLVLEDIPEIPQELVDSLNQYQNVRSAPFRGFTADGNSMYISTRFGDVNQLHRVDMAGGARHQLTFFKEPVGSVSRHPNSDTIAFTMDAGGNEFAQIFILDTNTGSSTILTDGSSRNGTVTWSSDGSMIAYQSTKRNGASNDIWVMAPNSPEGAEIVLESQDGSWWGPSDWSSGNTKLIAQQYVSASDSRIYMVDLETKEKLLVAGSETNTSANYALAFSGDDKGMFYITNEFSEFEQLAYKEFDSGTVTVISKDINWNIDGFSLSHDGKRAVFSVNEGGINPIFLLDTQSFEYKKVSGLPVGLAGSFQFSDDDTKLGLTLNNAQSPSDTFILELKDNATEHGELVRWTYSEVGGLDTSSFVIPELIAYKTFDDRDIPAFVYKPSTAGDKRVPVIIDIHGGPESQSVPYFDSTAQLWIERLGVAVIMPNVRGSSGYGKEYINLDNGFKREDSVKDIGALLDWIKEQPDLDEDRVAVFGGSYGGYMVLASAVHYSDRLKAAVDIVGISNFVTFLENTQDYRRDLRRVEYGDERDPEMRAFLESISPNNHVDKINVPMFVVQGQNDPRVPVTEAEQIVKALRENGKQVWYMNALNEGHGYRKRENRDVYTQAVVLFFEEFLIK